MITSVRFCLSNDLYNAILSSSNFVYLNENLHCCRGRGHDFTCSSQKSYVMCGHNNIHVMTLSTEMNMSVRLFLSAYDTFSVSFVGL